MAHINEIVVKTDASTRQGEGCGVAFICYICDSKGVQKEYCGKKYISKKVSTTKAETIATLYAMKCVQERFKDRSDYTKDFSLVIESDCQHAVQRINQSIYSEDIDKFINYYRRFFGEVRARWIPRAANEKADSMAREQFRKGCEGEL